MDAKGLIQQVQEETVGRKPTNLNLNETIYQAFKELCESLEPPVKTNRMLEVLMEEFIHSYRQQQQTKASKKKTD